ncbi:MAG: putative ABC transporter permease subunit [Chthonomonadales bacterium]
MLEHGARRGLGAHWAVLLFRLLRARVWSVRNAFLRAPRSERHSILWRALLLIGAPFLIGAMALGLFGPLALLARDDANAAELLATLPRLLLFGAFWMLALSSVTVTIQRFYTSDEISLLLLAPIPARSVFLAKFLDALTANTTLFLTVGIPVAAAYGFARGQFSVRYVAQSATALVVFSGVPTALGAAAAFLLMRALPASRLRELLGAAGILLGAAIYMVASLGLMAHTGDDARSLGFENLRVLAASPWAVHGPWAWASALITGPITRHSFANVAKLAAALPAACWGAAWVAQRLYWQGWAAYQEVPQRGGNLQAAVFARWKHILWMPAPMRGILAKDLVTIRRDLRQLSLLAIPVAASFGLMYNALHVDRAGPRILILVLGMYPVLGMIALRLSMSAFAMESRAMWLIAAAPPAPMVILGAKLLFAATFSLPLSMLICGAYAAAAELPAFQTWAILALSLVTTATFCSIGVGTHGLYMNPRHSDTDATMSGTGRTVSMVIEMGYLAGLDGILILCTVLAGMHVFTQAAAYLVAGGATLAWSGACSAAVLVYGARSLQRIEW